MIAEKIESFELTRKQYECMSDQVKNEKNVSSFALYIDKKLAKFDKITKMYIEKK